MKQFWPTIILMPVILFTAAILLASSVLVSAQTTANIQIPSAAPWTDTGIYLSQGSFVQIQASGQVAYGRLSQQVIGPDGGDYTGIIYFSDAVYPYVIGHSLIGKTGGTTSIGTGTPLPETGVYSAGFVGSSYAAYISTPGELFLGFNDAINTFSDNSGSFSVSITKTSPAIKTGDSNTKSAALTFQTSQEMVAEPVDTETGAHIINLSLLKIRGAQDLEFIIDYNSIARTIDQLGTGWGHNFEASLQSLSDGTVQVNWNSKKSSIFSPLPSNTNQFTCPDLPVVYDKLTLNQDGSYSLLEPNQRHYEFDSQGRLQQIVNPHGQPLQLVYQSTNFYASQIVETVSGKSLYLNYNASNLLAQVSDDLGRNVSFSYDSSSRLTQFVKNLGTVYQTNSFSYDAAGRVLSETNAEGYCIFTDTYDSQGRVHVQQDSTGRRTTFAYDESQTNRIFTTVTDRCGAAKVYVHDWNYQLLSITDGLGNTTSYAYDNFANKIAITNALGRVQSFAYDSSGNLTSATDATGQTTSSFYDGNNNLTNIVNALTNSASFTYDANNNLIASTDFLTNQTLLKYDTNSMLVQTTSPRSGLTTFAYVGGLPIAITDAATNTASMAYDTVGRLLAVTNAAGFVSTNAYDFNDNLTATSDGLGNIWRYTYDSAGRRLSATDPLSNSTIFAYNANGDLLTTTNSLGGVTTYAYDGEDRLASVTDANGNTKSLSYDAAGRLAFVCDALNHTNFFQYDAVGNLTATVDALGITNQITVYDVRNQPTTTQDAIGNTKRMSYDALMRIVQTVDALSRTNTMNYDALSRLTSTIDPLQLVNQQQFDGDGNRTAIINPKTAQFNFQYDLANRLASSTTAAGRTTGYTLDGPKSRYQHPPVIQRGNRIHL